MNSWFKRVFGIIGSFFKTVAQTAIGIAAEDISHLAMTVVTDLHNNSAISGPAKRNKAVDIIRETYPSIESAAINLAIETAWAIISDKLTI